MPSYENEPEDASEDDDNGLPILGGLATDAQVSFFRRVGDRILDRCIEDAHTALRQSAIRMARNKYERAWWLGGAWCGLALFHVGVMAGSGANAINVSMLLAVSIVTGWQAREITISHDEYKKELEQGEAW